MPIDDKSIKKLWALSGGFCGFPGCQENCVKHLQNSSYLIGEMAHVIAKKPKGPRGKKNGGSDTYDNLILLCPTHHTMVDKAPDGTYTVEQIHTWKADHEKSIREKLSLPQITNKRELFSFISRKLVETKAMWSEYGPESKNAAENPFSNLSDYWDFVKLQRVIPNNTMIVQSLKQYERYLSASDYIVSYQFIMHAEAFEASTYRRTESVPRFPVPFEEMINAEE